MTQINQLDVSAYTIPTDSPESDGTFEWDATTIVMVEAYANGHCGIGYTFGDLAIARLIDRQLSPVVVGKDVFRIPGPDLSRPGNGLEFKRADALRFAA